MPNDALFPEPKRVGRPNLPTDLSGLMARLTEALDSGWLSNQGPLVQRFEARMAERMGVAHGIAVCNATIGLEMMFRTLPASSEVVAPSFTFAATIQAARWVGLEVRLVDVDAETHLPTLEAVESAVGPSTSAAIGVHLWGEMCDLRGLSVPVLQDGAHAVGVDGVSTFGEATVLSFHATKFLNAFEGGMILTDDDALAEQLRTMRNFGIGGPVRGHGTNGKMSEASGAMGLTSMDLMDEVITRNRENHTAYAEVFAQSGQIRLLPLSRANNHQYVVVETANRIDPLFEVLGEKDGVFCRPYFRPTGHQILGLVADNFPVSERLSQCTGILPTGLQITPEEASSIATRIVQRLGEL